MNTLTEARIRLAGGGHSDITKGACFLEAAAWIAGEPWSDHPVCVSPVIAAFGRSWNDALNDADRHRLLAPYVVKILGTTTTDADDDTRAWLATDWLARVCTPAWLRLAGLEKHARALESLARIVDATTAQSAQVFLDAARGASVAAWDAARAAASAAARAAASAAARDAAWDAARAAASAAASAAAWDAAWDAARAAARAAAWDAASAAASVAAWDAASAAARDALAPTVAALQASALGLLDQMIAVGKREVPVLTERVARIAPVAP